MLLISGKSLLAQSDHILSPLYGYGKYGLGTIVRMDSCGNDLTPEYHFRPNTFGRGAGTDIIEHPNGKIYGLQTNSLFEYDIKKEKYTEKIVFDQKLYQTGETPLGRLGVSNKGLIYGTTRFGGNNNDGCIYAYNPANDSFEIVHHFHDSVAWSPFTGVLLLGQKLYGACSGGLHRKGLVYSYNITKGDFTVEHEYYDSLNPENELSGLTLVQNGNLLLTASDAFGHMSGMIAQLDTTNFQKVKQHRMDTVLGYAPSGRPYELPDGTVVGLAYSYTGRALWMYNTNSNSLDTIIREDSILDFRRGMHLYGQDKIGQLYFGGYKFREESDRIFRVGTNHSIKQIGSIDRNLTGNWIYTSPWVFTTNGLVYAMSDKSDVHTYGGFVQIDSTSWKSKQVFDFLNWPNGGMPTGGLIRHSSGTLIGIAVAGGKHASGVIYEYNANSKTVKGLASFTDELPGYKAGSLVEAQNKHLYGVIDNRTNTIFHFNPGNNTIQAANHLDSINLDKPWGSFINGPNGKLYGLAIEGGKHDLGGLYEFDPITHKLKLCYEFDSLSGFSTQGTSILLDSNKIVGVHSFGGKNNAGVFFEYNVVTDECTKIHEFYSTSNYIPISGNTLLKFGSQYFVRAVNSGNVKREGILVFDRKKDTSWMAHEFLDEPYPARAIMNLFLTKKQKILGYTYLGGKANLGVLFEFDPINHQFKKLTDFDYQTGQVSGNFFVQITGLPVDRTKPIGKTMDLYPNPTNGRVRAHYPDAEIEQLIVYNLSGIEVFRDSYQTEINLSHLPPGMYTIVGLTKTEEQIRSKLMLQH